MNRIYLRKSLLIIIIVIVSATSCTYKKNIDAKNIILPVYFQNNMILQQGKKLHFYGLAYANSTLAIRIESTLKYVKADANGEWNVTFPKLKYNKPFNVFIEGADTVISLHNVRLGDIYVMIGDGMVGDFKKMQKEIIKTTQGVFENSSVFTAIDDTNKKNDLHYSWQIEYPELVMQTNQGLYKLIASVGSVSKRTTGFINLCEHYTYKVPYFDSVLKVDSTILATVQDVKYNDAYWKSSLMPVDFKGISNKEKQILWMRKKVYLQKEERGNTFKLHLGDVAGCFSVYFNTDLLVQETNRTKNIEITIPGELTENWLNVLSFRVVNPDSLTMISDIPVLTSVEDTNRKITLRYGWKISQNYEKVMPADSFDNYRVDYRQEAIKFPVKSLVYLSGYDKKDINTSSPVHDSLITGEKYFIQQDCLPFNYLPYKAGFDSLLKIKTNKAKTNNYKIVYWDCLQENIPSSVTSIFN